eukprot:scaffold30288_cov18-Tisochrysis_lutea.AAC.2
MQDISIMTTNVQRMLQRKTASNTTDSTASFNMGHMHRLEQGPENQALPRPRRFACYHQAFTVVVKPSPLTTHRLLQPGPQ